MSKIERIRPGAKAFIVHNGKILIIKERLPGEAAEVIHDLPGGGIELGETIHDALHREVMEEVGLTIEIVRPVGCWGFVNHLPLEDVHIVCMGYQCRLIGEPTIDVHNNPAEEDIFEAVWLTKEEILDSGILTKHPDMALSLENVQI